MHKADNETDHFISAITLDHAWPRPHRLFFVLGVTIFATIMNGFFVASFFVNDYLKRIGYIFKMCVGVSDMVVSVVVMPAAVFILITEHGDTETTCHILQYLTEGSLYSCSIFFAMMSFETLFRNLKSANEYEALFKKRIDILIIMTFATCFAVAGVGVVFKLDYDFCFRNNSGNLMYRFTTNLILHVIPGLITVTTSVGTCMVMNRRARTDSHYRRSILFKNDSHVHYVNMAAYIIYVTSWLPCIMLVHGYAARDNLFYTTVWIGLSRTVVTSCLYFAMDKNFRRAFMQLLFDCCCRSLIFGRMMRRRRRAIECRDAARDSRIILMERISSHRRAPIIPRDARV